VCALCALSALMVASTAPETLAREKSAKKSARRSVSTIGHCCWFRWRQPATIVLSPCWSRCRNVRTKRTKRTKSVKRAGPAIGDSVVRKIRALSALCALRGCLSLLVILIKGRRTGQSPYKPPPGRLFLKKVREKREKREKSPSYVQACRSLLDNGGFAAQSRQGRILHYAWNPFLRLTNGTICLPVRYLLAIVPFVTRSVVPRPRLAWGARWWGVSQVVKTAQSRGRTERTLLRR
jgi:hypothetical protein